MGGKIRRRKWYIKEMWKRVIEEIEKSNINLFVKFRLNLLIKYINFD